MELLLIAGLLVVVIYIARLRASGGKAGTATPQQQRQATASQSSGSNDWDGTFPAPPHVRTGPAVLNFVSTYIAKTVETHFLNYTSKNVSNMFAADIARVIVSLRVCNGNYEAAKEFLKSDIMNTFMSTGYLKTSFSADDFPEVWGDVFNTYVVTNKCKS